MHIIGQKTPILSKIYFIMGQKSQQNAFFSSIFHEKINALMPIYCQKNLPFCEKHVALMPIFCQEKVHSLKTRSSHVIFCNFYMKKSHNLLSFARSVKITSILSKLQSIMGQKSRYNSIFFRFSRKNHCSHVHILSKTLIF